MEQFTFFWKQASPFSQWHLAEIDCLGMKFNCNEQAMMFYKAMTFGDTEVANKILATSNPFEQKKLGRQVRNFDADEWSRASEVVVYGINHCKFTQHDYLFDALMATKGTTLVEASPFDKIWGIGLDQHDPRAWSRETWQGANLLGEILTDIRENLIREGR